MSVEWLDCFEAVLEALKLHLEMMVHVLWIAEERTFEVHHNLLGGNHMLDTMPNNSNILWLHQYLVVSLVSYWMGHGGRTGERVEMLAARVGNYTPVEDEFDMWITQIECLSSEYFQHDYLILPPCPLRIVVSNTCNSVELGWLSSAEIHSSTLYMNNTIRVIQLSMQFLISNGAEYRRENWR
jgi:hypothetical protein